MTCCSACNPITRYARRVNAMRTVVGGDAASPSIDEGPPVYNEADGSLTYASGSRVFPDKAGVLQAVSAQGADGTWKCPPGTSMLWIGDETQPDCRFPTPIVNKQGATLSPDGSVAWKDGSHYDNVTGQYTSAGGTVVDLEGNLVAKGSDYCKLYPNDTSCTTQNALKMVAAGAAGILVVLVLLKVVL